MKTQAIIAGARRGLHGHGRARRTLLVFMAGAPVVLALSATATGTRARAGPAGTALIFTQVPYKTDARGGRPPGFLLNRAGGQGSRLCSLSSTGAFKVLTPEFAAAADSSVSFDAARIVFAARRSTQDAWNIWEMRLDGTDKRQLTRDLGNCREPEYLARSSITPPDFTDKVRWITFVSDGAGVFAEGGSEAATSLYVTNTEPIRERGTVVWRTTFNLSSDFSPAVLRDGRVLFTSTQRASRTPGSGLRYPLLSSNWDGSGLNLFCGDEQGAAIKTMAVESDDRHLVFVEAPTGQESGGRLARVSFRRPLRTHEVLSKESGYYLYPRPLPEGRLLTSFTGGRESYGLFVLDYRKGSRGVKLFDDPQWEDLDGQPVMLRPEPQGLISSVVEGLDWADLHCMSVYESDRPPAATRR